MIKLNSQIKGTANFGSWKLPLQAHRTWDRTKVAAERWRWLRMMHTKCFRTSGICLIEQTWWWSHTSPTRQSTLAASPAFLCLQQRHKPRCWGLVTHQDWEEPPCVSTCPQKPTKGTRSMETPPSLLHTQTSTGHCQEMLCWQRKRFELFIFFPLTHASPEIWSLNNSIFKDHQQKSQIAVFLKIALTF